MPRVEKELTDTEVLSELGRGPDKGGGNTSPSECWQYVEGAQPVRVLGPDLDFLKLEADGPAWKVVLECQEGERETVSIQAFFENLLHPLDRPVWRLVTPFVEEPLSESGDELGGIGEELDSHCGC